MDIFSTALHCTPASLIDNIGETIVPIIATIGAGAIVYPIDDLPLYRNSVSESEAMCANCETVEAPPGESANNIVARKVDGDSMMPFMPPGTIVYYSTRLNGDGLNDWINKLCVVQIVGGATYVKLLKRGSQYGKYNLASYAMSEMENVEILWAARIQHIKLA